jgi:hypothetical protein
MLAWVVQNAAVTLVLALVVAGICRVGRLGPASRHALWLVARAMRPIRPIRHTVGNPEGVALRSTNVCVGSMIVMVQRV